MHIRNRPAALDPGPKDPVTQRQAEVPQPTLGNDLDTAHKPADECLHETTKTTTDTSRPTETATTLSPEPSTAAPTEDPPSLDALIQPTLSPQVQALRQANQDGALRLGTAIERGKLDEVKAVLAELPLLLNAPLNDQATALHMVARTGNLEILDFLLAQDGIELNPVNADGFTPLHTAVAENQADAVARLLGKTGVQVDAALPGGATALFLAVQKNNVQVAQQLLIRGAGINVRTADGNAVLHFAADSGNLAILELLLDPVHQLARSAIHLPNEAGATPLRLAINAKNATAAELLLKQPGLDPNGVDALGMTPLHQAILNNDVPCIELLLAHKKIKVNKSTAPGNLTPFHVAIEGQQLEIARLLLDHGADINTRLNGEFTPLHLVCHRGELATVKWLMDPQTAKGKYPPALLNEVTSHGQTPLHLAVLEGRELVVAHIAATPEVNLNTKDAQGWAPLHEAIRGGHTNIVKSMLGRIDPMRPETRADPDLLGPHRLNILHMLSLADKPMPLQRAIRAAIDPGIFQKLVNTPDEWDAYPVSLAAQRGRGKDLISDLRPTVRVQPKPLEPTTYKRGWLIAGQDHPNWEGLDLAAKGRDAGIKMETYGNGREDLTWEGLKQLDIRAGDFVICSFHAGWDEKLQRVMLDLGNGVRVPLVDMARLLFEKGALKVLFLGCEVSMSANPFANRFASDPTISRPTDDEGGYEGLDYAFVGREEETLMALNQDAAGLCLDDCIAKRSHSSPTSAIQTRSTQPLYTVGWARAQRNLAVAQRPELTVDTLDPNLTPDQAQSVKNRLMHTYYYDNNVKAVEDLLANKHVAVDTPIDWGMNVLQLASLEGHTEMVKKALLHGADMHREDANGTFPLYNACSHGHMEVVRALLDEGANIDQRTSPKFDSYGALHIACDQGFADVVALLLERGASTTAKNDLGETPIETARQAGRTDIVDLLEAHARPLPL